MFFYELLGILLLAIAWHFNSLHCVEEPRSVVLNSIALRCIVFGRLDGRPSGPPGPD